MKILFLVCFLLATGFSISTKSKASGLLSAELQYAAVAPNVYVVVYHVTRDCQSAVFPNSKDLQVAFPGCRPPRIITLNKVGHPTTIGDIYCKAVGNSCASGALPNYEKATYTATFIFTSAEVNCALGLFVMQECPGIETANVASTSGNCTSIQSEIPILVSHAFTPESYDFSMPVFTVNVPAIANFLVSNSQNILTDSLVYSLVPLSYNSPFSATNPLPSSTPVILNPITGQLSFTPNLFNNSGLPGANDYAVLVEVKVYSKTNGIYRFMGSMKRLKTIRIVNNTPNVYPEIINVFANGKQVLANNIIRVQEGSTLNMHFNTADGNLGDSVEIEIANANYPFQPWQLNMTSTGGYRPSGNLTAFIPQVGSGKIYFPIIVKDNACPVRGVTSRIFELQILANPLGLKAKVASQAMVSVYPNPFTKEVSFKFNSQIKAESILIYNLLGQQVDQIFLPKNVSAEQPVTWKNALIYASGTYVAKIISEGKMVQTLKFTKLQ